MSSAGITLFISSFFCLLGAIFGSAVTALSWRLPRGESWAHGRSMCPACGHVLGPLELVPVLDEAEFGAAQETAAAPLALEAAGLELGNRVDRRLILRMQRG